MKTKKHEETGYAILFIPGFGDGPIFTSPLYHDRAVARFTAKRLNKSAEWGDKYKVVRFRMMEISG